MKFYQIIIFLIIIKVPTDLESTLQMLLKTVLRKWLYSWEKNLKHLSLLLTNCSTVGTFLNLFESHHPPP